MDAVKWKLPESSTEEGHYYTQTMFTFFAEAKERAVEA
jgi:hypothetical protein